MLNYFLRRLALVPITFVVITFMVYGILRVAPGGPIEQLKRQMTAGGEAGAGGGGDLTGDVGLTEEAIEELKRYYNLDKSIPVGYLEWLGVKPFDNRIAVSLDDRKEDPGFWAETDALAQAYRAKKVEFDEALLEQEWKWEGDLLLVPISAERRALDTEFFEEADALRAKGVRYYSDFKEHLATRGFALIDEKVYGPITDADRQRDSGYTERIERLRGERRAALDALEERLEPRSMAVGSTGKIYHVRTEFSGILQGDFGWSFEKGRPALDEILSRMPISAYFGIIGYLMTWIVCVPLGVFKAIRHNSISDLLTSIVVFLGYAFPGFVACLLIYINFGGSIFPVGGFRSAEWDTWWAAGEYWRCIKDQLAHTAVPIFGYMVGSFAAMTVLMKNSLMENLGADYVRTAFAKGLPSRRVIFVHALRNSLIPITAGVGHAIGILFAGSFLIEQACNIPGMGLLGVESILARDYPITLGILVFGVLIRLFGNILSDLIWALIDPRIRFE